MTKEEWLEWSVPRYEEFDQKYPGERPNVARFRDQGHYEIGNIELVTAKKNVEDQVRTITDIIHGTVGGFHKEKRRGLDICELCKAAQKSWTEEYSKTYIRKRDRK